MAHLSSTFLASALSSSFSSYTKSELIPAMMATRENETIGAGNGVCAIRGERIVASLATTLQIPNAVPVKAVGNAIGVAR